MPRSSRWYESCFLFVVRPQPHPAAGPVVPARQGTPHHCENHSLAHWHPMDWRVTPGWYLDAFSLAPGQPSPIVVPASYGFPDSSFCTKESPRERAQSGKTELGASFPSSSLSLLLAGCSCAAWCGTEHSLNYRSALLISASGSQRSSKLEVSIAVGVRASDFLGDW